eukprot:gnl/TRDRNA2_/TRDRNA2_195373_c0_seq1.p1 gnl/TRDRNA2_/TRDRNA2_195373_c0~~gnl/TRDRNA2_/TRDRNA2_195373_c0_seq1.p1  ORF type:complete len:223 (+),score=34.82 gnl/TRDRNA2_/TRDRNA2_195373_c0_seq1:72-740(+)
MATSAQRQQDFLPAPPYKWISWAILAAYLGVFVETICVMLSQEIPEPWHATSDPYGDGDAVLVRTLMHLCGIYLVEVLLAVGPGWCAMSPGWTSFDVSIHHVPYMCAVALGIYLGAVPRWRWVARISLLTSLNEGMFIAYALGAPSWTSKVRRLYGFSIVFALLSSEVLTYLANLWEHVKLFYRDGNGMSNAVAEMVVLPAMMYHFRLLGFYVKRWRKTKEL